MPNYNDACFSMPIGPGCVLKRNDVGAEIILDNDKSFSITMPESSVLRKLLEANGEVVNKNELISEGWGRPDIIGPNSLPVAITNLRKILDLSGVKIINVPRKGYRLDVSHAEPAQLGQVTQKEAVISSMEQVTTPGYSSPFTITRLLGALFCLCLSLYGFMYMAFSWVSIDCQKIGRAEVCVIDGDSFDPRVLEGRQGRFYYSSQSGLVAVEI
jgi:DNA-binding winged helix-turn-helix (wHTH) protein